MDPKRVFRWILGIAVGTVVMGLPTFLFVWQWLDLETTNPNFWYALAALSSFGTFSTIVSGLLMMEIRLKEIARTRKRERAIVAMQVYADVFHMMMTPDQIVARKWIYEFLRDPATASSEIPQDGREHVKLVLNTLDYLGFLVKNDWHNSEAIIEWVRPMVQKVWVRIQPLVERERERRNEPTFYISASHLAERCQAHHPLLDFEVVDGAL